MISTSFMAGTGLKKCIPRNFSGRCDAAASSVMLKEEVLETKIASGLMMGAILAKASFFSAMFSTMASKTMSTSFRSSSSMVAFRWPSQPSACSWVILPLATFFSKPFLIPATPFSRVGVLWLYRTTS